MKTKILLLSSYLFLATAFSVQAIPINGSYTAVVTAVTAPPDFSVRVGDTIGGQFGYDTDLLLPPDANGNRIVVQPQDHFDFSAFFDAAFTWGTQWERTLWGYVIGPDGVPVGASCLNMWGIAAELSGTSLVISGPISNDGNGEVIHATITSYSGVPDASSSVGLMGLALSALAAFWFFTRHNLTFCNIRIAVEKVATEISPLLPTASTQTGQPRLPGLGTRFSLKTTISPGPTGPVAGEATQVFCQTT